MPGYLGNDPSGSATKIARQTYTTSGAATTDFTFTSGYDVGYLDVYVNGERQTKGKNFTASDGSTFKVLNGGVGTGSTVEAIAYKTFNLATVDFDDLGNTGNLTLTGDISGVNATFTGDVSIGGTLTYEDVTNIDSVGVITARSGVDIITGGIDIVGNTTGLNVSGVGTFTGDVSIADKIIHTGDTNTAIRFPAADTFTVETGGSERLRVGAGGTITIGDSSFGDSLGQLRIINDASSAPASLALFGHNNTTTGDPFGQIQFAEQEAGTGGNIKAKIEAQAVSTNERGSDLVFFTAADSASSVATERLRITNGGDVGIGTASPTSFGPTLQVAGTDPALLVQDTATAVDYFGMNIASGAVNTWFDDASAFVIHTATGLAGSGLVERLRITSGGDVGIGTDVPDALLHVFTNTSSSDTSEPVAIFECDTSAGGDVSIRLEGGASSNPDEIYVEFCDKDDSSNSWAIGLDDDAGHLYIGNGTKGTMNAHTQIKFNKAGGANFSGIATASQLFEGSSRVATAGKAVAMALVFG